MCMDSCSELGFWEYSLKNFFEDHKIKVLTRLQILRFNYDNRIDNANALAEYNKYILEQTTVFGRIRRMDFYNTFTMTKVKLADLFVSSDKGILNLAGLMPVFILYGLGISLSIIVFAMELCYFRLKTRFRSL